jgi:hypothetical protein
MPNFATPVACAQDNTPGRFGFPTTLKSFLVPFIPAKSAIYAPFIASAASLPILLPASSWFMNAAPAPIMFTGAQIVHQFLN